MMRQRSRAARISRVLCALFLMPVILLGGCSVLSQLLPTQPETQPDWENLPATLPDSAPKISRYYYEQLSRREQHAYSQILAEIEQFPKRIVIPMLNSGQLNRVFAALSYDNPRLMLFGARSRVEQESEKAYFVCDYRFGREEYQSMLEKLNQTVDAILAGLDSNAGEWETELYLHDAIVSGCIYETGAPYESTAYGALVEKKATCEGYARAMKLLMDAAGLVSYVLGGKGLNQEGKQEDHMWNIVRIDGAYYHLDPTWNDPISQEEQSGQRYLYFNLSDAEIAPTHSAFQSVNPCVSTEANYYRRAGQFFSQYDGQTRTAIAKCFIKQIAKGNHSLDLRFADKQSYEQALDGLFEQQQVYRIFETVNLSAKQKIDTGNVKYIKNDALFAISLFANWQDSA